MRNTIKFGFCLVTAYTAFSTAILRVDDKPTLALLAVGFIVSVSGLFLYYATKKDED